MQKGKRRRLVRVIEVHILRIHIHCQLLSSCLDLNAPSLHLEGNNHMGNESYKKSLDVEEARYTQDHTEFIGGYKLTRLCGNCGLLDRM